MNEFVKSQALGNTFVVLDSRKLDFQLTPDAIRLLCDRDRGIGADGILLLATSKSADFGMRVFNADGSEAEMSGNGCRIAAKYIHDHSYTDALHFDLDVGGIIVRCELVMEGGKVGPIRTALGRASFDAADVPVDWPDGEAIGAALRIDEREFNFTALSTGNPHCVIFMDRADEIDPARFGSRIEQHAIFPNRANVEFVTILDRGRIGVRLWERGVGPTTCSGTGALAAAAAAVKNGLAQRTLLVEMPGGALRATIGENFELLLEGPAEEIISGTLSPDLRARL